MAVIKLVHVYRDRQFCVVIDPEADSVAVVSEGGFDLRDEGEIELCPAHYDEVGPFVSARIDDETGQPVGIMAEQASRRPFERFGRRRTGSAFRTLNVLLAAAFQAFPLSAVGTESMLSETADPMETLRRLEGREFELV